MRWTMPMITTNGHRVALLVLSVAMALALPGRALGQERKESIAVLDLEGRGISAIEAATLTDRLRSELVKTGAVTVVERGQMQTILAEQDFQMAGCTSDECAVEIGQMLGVTMMYSGSIGKIGATYTVDVRGVSVETGQIVNTMSRDYRGEIDGLITEIEHLAWDLVGMVNPDELLGQLRDGPGIDLDDVAGRGRKGDAKPKKGFGLVRMIVIAGILGGGGIAVYALLPEDEPPVVDQGIGSPPGFPNP